MATVIIGAQKYDVPELNFTALERAWPFVDQAMTSLDPIQGVSAAIHIIAAGLCEADNFDLQVFGIAETSLDSRRSREEQIFELVSKFLKRKTKATEIDGVRKAVLEITREAGLEPKEGEEERAEEKVPSPSTETSDQSSLNLSQPDAKVEAGT